MQIPPSLEALIKIESEEEYSKYRNLMFMHINMLIMRDHMKIAARYDKRRIYFTTGLRKGDRGEPGYREDMYGRPFRTGRRSGVTRSAHSEYA